MTRGVGSQAVVLAPYNGLGSGVPGGLGAKNMTPGPAGSTRK